MSQSLCPRRQRTDHALVDREAEVKSASASSPSTSALQTRNKRRLRSGYSSFTAGLRGGGEVSLGFVAFHQRPATRNKRRLRSGYSPFTAGLQQIIDGIIAVMFYVFQPLIAVVVNSSKTIGLHGAMATHHGSPIVRLPVADRHIWCEEFIDC